MKRPGGPGLFTRLAVGAFGLLCAPALLRSQTVTVVSYFYGLGGAMTTGPDGNIWFPDCTNPTNLVRLIPPSTTTEFPVGALQCPVSMTTGSDGNLWMVGPSGVSRYSLAGTITPFPLPEGSPFAITSGPDGNLWLFVDIAGPSGDTLSIDRMTPAGFVTEFPFPEPPPPPGYISSGGPVAGPDGNVWFTFVGQNGNVIGRITPAGAITEFPLPAGEGEPVDITSGPDGALWFTERGPDRIGRITTSGAVTSFGVPAPGASPYRIVQGSDGNLWFLASSATGTLVGRLTVDGQFTYFGTPTIPGDPSYPPGFTGAFLAGPDGNLWFSESQRIAQGAPGENYALLRVNLAPASSSIPALDGRGLAALAALLAGAGIFALKRL